MMETHVQNLPANQKAKVLNTEEWAKMIRYGLDDDIADLVLQKTGAN